MVGLDPLEVAEGELGVKPDTCPQSLWDEAVWRQLDFMTRPDPQWHCNPIPHPCNCKPDDPRRGW